MGCLTRFNSRRSN